MSTLPAMPDKWAVKIESEAEAKELQALFLDATNAHGQSLLIFFNRHKKDNNALYLAIHPNFKPCWGYDYLEDFKAHGYTIYTLSQLKELLK